MKILERRMLRGPNIHSDRPCFLAVLDLESLDDVSSASVPGFVDALLAAMPTLQRHRCSPGYVGGFVERLRDGTYMAHIVEHVTIELQCIAGTAVGFGKTRAVRGKPRQYRVVVAYKAEGLVEAALDVAIALVTRLAASEPYDLAEHLERLTQLADQAMLGPSTRAIVDAAEQRGIPAFRLSLRGSLFQLGWGARQQRIQATITSQTNHVAVGIASDKELTKQLLAEAGLPVPRGRTVSSFEGALAAARSAGRAVAIKPLDGNQGKGVTTAVTGDEAVGAAFQRAQAFSRRVIVEQHITGDDYRVLVIGDQLVAASRRVPPEVTGDGHSTIRQLVDVANADPRRGDGHMNVLTKIRLDDAAVKELGHQSLDFDAVPGAGRVVRLRGNANLSTGGTAQDVTSDVHPDTAWACVRAARKIGLDVAGIDLVCGDIARPLADQGGAIIEVNAAPGIRMHEHPSFGERHHVGRAIVDSLFPDDGDGRIPVVAVTGTNGKTTTTLAIAHVMQRLGRVTGAATTEGVTIAGRRVVTGDCTGYWSARTVLMAPEVEFAVLETARGGMLKRGLAFDRCDVGVVLNVTGDHLGQDGIETVEDLGAVKGLVVGTARKAVVLNADDPICVGLARRARRGTKIVYFGFDPERGPMHAHLERGGCAVFEHHGMIMWADGTHRVPLVASDQLPSTLGGRARHNVANAMAACAALLAAGIPRDRIVAGLVSFNSNEIQNPLRMNVYQVEGVTLMVDYAHNVAAYRAIIDTTRQLAKRRLIGVISAPGDRRAEDLEAIGRVCADGFDRLVIYEMDDQRRQAAGATAEAIARGARSVLHSAADGRSTALDIVLDIREAIRHALRHAEPGDFIVVGCASHLSELRDALGSAHLSSVSAESFGVSGSQDPLVGAVARTEPRPATDRVGA